MGKTRKVRYGLSPYEFYQYWRNVADADVLKCIHADLPAAWSRLMRWISGKEADFRLTWFCTSFARGWKAM